MTPTESLQLREFERRVNARLDAQDEEIKSVQALVEPSVSFYRSLARAGIVIREGARFVKWGAGLGASAVTVLLGLRMLGII